MMVREPVFAQQGWYPLGREACVQAIEAMKVAEPPADLPARPVAGIVPHAGWSFSGATALGVIRAIASRRQPKTFVLMGAWHRARRPAGILFPSGGWETPLGIIEIDERLASEIASRAGDLVIEDPEPHGPENSLELQVPLIQHETPEAKIVPILVPHWNRAAELGRIVGQTIQSMAADAVCIGSTDLTHYGPMYGFTPRGTGEAALAWVRDENDKRMLDVMIRLDAEAAVPEAQRSANACGAGAIAATLAAARELGATRGYVVSYTTSYDVMRERMGRSDYEAAVGYVGVVF
jgi:AmmeMemoRadiSam system protein B